MSPWTPLPKDEELARADELLGQADALLRRHRGGEPGAVVAAAAGFDDPDLPILTDVVDEAELPALGLPASTPSAPTPATAAAAAAAASLISARAALADELVELDTEITRQVEAWLEAELPQIVARELDQFTERLHAEALARLRATLLPALSERIASRIDKLVD